MNKLNLDMSTQAGYDIATAMRGPDYTKGSDGPSEYAPKQLTAAVIRYLVGAESCGGDNNSPERAQKWYWDEVGPEKRADIRGWFLANAHYTHHFFEALLAFTFLETPSPEAAAYRTWFEANVLSYTDSL